MSKRKHQCDLGKCWKEVAGGRLIKICCKKNADSAIVEILGYTPKAAYKLGSGEAMHRKHPRTFQIPDAVTRTEMAKGDHAKLIFKKGRSGERMWVKITSRSGTGAKTKYEGKLANSPALIESLGKGDLVAFAPRHIIATQQKGLGYSPLSKSQRDCATNFISEEMDAYKGGNKNVRSRKQAVAIGMSRARREC